MNVELTKLEIEAALWAIGNHTDANGRHVSYMTKEGLTRDQALALLRADTKLRMAASLTKGRAQ